MADGAQTDDDFLNEAVADVPEDEWIDTAVEAPPVPAGASPRASSPAYPEPPRPPPETKDPGFLRTIGRQALSGFFKQGSDEAMGALGQTAMPESGGVGYRMPDGTTRYVKTGDDLYRAVRDDEREVLRGANEHRPILSMLANMGGDIASDMALKALGVPVDSSAYQTAVGALGGLLGSDAELSTDNVKASDAVTAGGSALVGGALGYAVPKVGAAVSRHVLPAVMPRVRQAFEDYAIGKGRRVLLNGADALAGNKELAAESVREALESGAIRPFRTTQDAYRSLETLAEMRGENYASILQRLQEAGVEGPGVEDLARRFSAEYADRWYNSGANKDIANVFLREADNVRNVAPEDAVNLDLLQAERIKRVLQNEARWDRLRETGLDEAKQEVSSVYRSEIERAIEDAGNIVPPGSEVAQLADEFIPVKQQLSRTIDARDAAERGQAAAAKRRGISFTDYLAAGAAAGGGPATQLMAAMGNNFARTRGTSAVAAGAYGASKVARNLARPEAAEAFGNELGALAGRQVQVDKAEGLARRGEAPGMAEFRDYVRANPQAMGRYGRRLAEAAAAGPDAFALQDWMMAQSDPEYQELRRQAFGAEPQGRQ